MSEKVFNIGDRVQCIQPHMTVYGRVKAIKGKDLVVTNHEGYDRIVPIVLTEISQACECVGTGDICKLRPPHLPRCVCSCHEGGK